MSDDKLLGFDKEVIRGFYLVMDSYNGSPEFLGEEQAELYSKFRKKLYALEKEGRIKEYEEAFAENLRIRTEANRELSGKKKKVEDEYDDPYYTTAMFPDSDELYNNYEDEQQKKAEPIIKEEQNQDNKKKQQEESHEEEEETETSQQANIPFYQCPYNLLNITKKALTPLIAHKIIYMWKTSKQKDIYRYAPINNTVLATAFNITEKTLKTHIDVLEDLKIIHTKKGREGKKFYKVNKKEAMKYFNKNNF